LGSDLVPLDVGCPLYSNGRASLRTSPLRPLVPTGLQDFS